MKHVFHIWIVGALLAMATGNVAAQDIGQLQKQVPFFAAALSQLLSDSRSFAASAELQLPAAPGETPVKLPFGVAMLDGKIRWELDLGRVKSTLFEPQVMEMLKQFKLDRVALIIQPEKNLQILFPGLSAYLEMPPPKPEAGPGKAQDKIERLEKKLVGREMVDGYECLKYQLTVADTKQETAFVWNATKLKDFPIKLNVHFEKGVYGFHFTNVRLGNPDARYFAVPANYQRFASPEALMQSIMAKSLGDGLDLKKLGDLNSLLEKAP